MGRSAERPGGILPEWGYSEETKIRLCLLEAGCSLGNWPGYLALHSHYQQVILAPYPLPGEE